MPVGIEEDVLELEIAMGNTLTVEVANAVQKLPEAALDFAGTHATLPDGAVEVDPSAELRDLAPV